MVGFRSAVPFPDIVGQERLKRALLAVAVNDALDGLLIRGEKGTAKSTAVRGLVELLPDQRAIADCPYGCPPEEPARQCNSCRGREDPPVETRPVPLVTVPLGVTRERLVGSLSLSDALDGESTFEPGLLARANRGVLYVDEVNLLDDHLVDVLLDAAASGVNRVERDGMSETHPAEFTLIGTMNPEEGDLRPQLRDRFAIQVEVTGTRDVEERVAIVESALGRTRELDPGSDDDAELDRLRRTIGAARDDLGDVTLPRELATTIVEVCLDAGVDGHRGDIAAARTARTFATLDGRRNVTEGDVREALGYALPHRLRSRPFEETEPIEDLLAEHFDESDSDPGDSAGDTDEIDRKGEREPSRDGDSANDAESEASGAVDGTDTPGDAGGHGPARDHSTDTEDGRPGTGRSETEPATGRDRSTTDAAETPVETVGEEEPRSGADDRSGNGEQSKPTDGEQLGPTDDNQSDETTGDRSEDPGSERTARPPSGELDRVTPVESNDIPGLNVDDGTTAGATVGAGRLETDPDIDAVGPRVRTEPADAAESVDAAATIRAGAKRGRTDVQRQDLRQSVRAGSATALVVFAVDASASMRPAMEAAKGTVLELLKESYRERDEVAFVTFAGEEATVLLPPTDSVSLAARHLKELPTGDRTPLPDGLATARRVIDRADPAASVAVVVTDGRPNVAGGRPTAATRTAACDLGESADEVLVVDASQPDDRATVTGDLVEAADGRTMELEDLSPESVQSASRSARQ
ncbi:VWA domain-containing protein [Halorhabdus amylolytica]|uniref:VWA domain-containing protein n=1 Tax=Halorhabdus amylolytica TaxID=2559573 RepID=UPI0010AA2362|nr:VWA domain-containing protein [Halorhabdus amylolytica]